MTAAAAVLRDWIRTPFFLVYLRRCLILAAGIKATKILIMLLLNDPEPFGFDVLPESFAIVVAWLALGSLMRRNGEDILLANVGLSAKFLFWLLVVVSLAVNLLVSLVG